MEWDAPRWKGIECARVESARPTDQPLRMNGSVQDKGYDHRYDLTGIHFFAQNLKTERSLFRRGVLEVQITRLRRRIKTHCDAGLHALRHTFLTEAGEHTDPFTLQYVAGHDNIKTTMRYVHPREDAVEKLFARLGNLPRPETRVECKRSVQNPVQSQLPSEADLAKILNAWQLQRAEVVELADTPS